MYDGKSTLGSIGFGRLPKLASLSVGVLEGGWQGTSSVGDWRIHKHGIGQLRFLRYCVFWYSPIGKFYWEIEAENACWVSGSYGGVLVSLSEGLREVRSDRLFLLPRGFSTLRVSVLAV